MAESIRSKSCGKPEKPYPGFPLTAHPSGRWCKKIAGRIHFFGRWGNKRGSEVVPVGDVAASAAAAKEQLDRDWPYLSTGRTPPPVDDGLGCRIDELCNRFLTSKRRLLLSGELSAHTFGEYYRVCERLVRHFGKGRRVDDLRPADFEAFRAVLAKDCGTVTLHSRINRCRVVFKYANDAELIDRPVRYGKTFDRPTNKNMRKAANESTPKLFSRDELLQLLKAADPVMTAMVLLGINCGFGNTDLATLPVEAIDFEQAVVTFPRPKTGVERRIPLWPETAAALRVAIAARPAAKDEADAGLCFLTSRGTRLVRVQESKTTGRHVTINALGKRFGSLLSSLDIGGRRGFYGLRHTFATQAAAARDRQAVQLVMGHASNDILSGYAHGEQDERLRAVVGVVREWLFATPAKLTGGAP